MYMPQSPVVSAETAPSAVQVRAPVFMLKSQPYESAPTSNSGLPVEESMCYDVAFGVLVGTGDVWETKLSMRVKLSARG